MRDIHPATKFFALLLALWLTGAVAFTASQRLAHADPKPGLWQESVTQADGVTIRKIRDTTGGQKAVCYVASRMIPAYSASNTSALSIAISCVPEKRP